MSGWIMVFNVHRCHHGGGWVSGEPGEVSGVLDGPAHIVGVGGEGGLDGEVPGPAVVPIGGYDDYVGVLKAPDLPWLEPRGVTRFHQVAEVVLVEYLLLPATVRAMRRGDGREAPFLAWPPGWEPCPSGARPRWLSVRSGLLSAGPRHS